MTVLIGRYPRQYSIDKKEILFTDSLERSLMKAKLTNNDIEEI